jgi:hypothetical protein
MHERAAVPHLAASAGKRRMPAEHNRLEPLIDWCAVEKACAIQHHM